jgi:hypothetical protein
MYKIKITATKHLIGCVSYKMMTQFPIDGAFRFIKLSFLYVQEMDLNLIFIPRIL